MPAVAFRHCQDFHLLFKTSADKSAMAGKAGKVVK
jgi:hypothetical protein